MDILFLLIPIALVIVGGAIAGFWWATRDGQFDDLDTPAVRILLDDKGSDSKSNSNSQSR